MIPKDIKNLIKNLSYVCIEIGLNNTGSMKYINNNELLVLGGTSEENLGLNWIDMFLPIANNKNVTTTFQKIHNLIWEKYLSNSYSIVTLFGKKINIIWKNII
jgi:hypothetical protein